MNQSLGMFGFPCDINFRLENVSDKVKVVNTLYALLNDHQVRQTDRV